MNIGVKVVLPFLPENKADILLPTEKTSGAYPPIPEDKDSSASNETNVYNKKQKHRPCMRWPMLLM